MTNADQLYPPKFFRPFKTFYAATYGFGASRTAAQNTAAINAAYAKAVLAGGGTVVIDSPGTCAVGVTGTNPYQASTQYLFDVAGNDIRTVIENGTTLRLPNATQTDAGGFVFGFVWRNRLRLTFEGEGIFDLNSQNQSGWTLGYGQQSGGHFNGYATQAGGGIHDNTVKNLTLLNTFGNPVNLGNLGSSNQAINTRCYTKELKCRVYGEGLQLIGVTDGEHFRNVLDDTGNTSRGDNLEISNCLNIVVGYNRVYGDGTNSLAGSGLDGFGSKKVSVIGNMFDGVNDAMSFDNGVGGSICDIITVDGNIVNGCRAGLGVAPSGTINFSGNHWKTITATSSLQFSRTNGTALANFNGDTFEACRELLVSGLHRVNLTGCHIKGGSSHGITLSRDGSGNVPKVSFLSGSIRGMGGYAVATSSNGSAFSPEFVYRDNDLRTNTSGVIGHFAGGDAAAFVESNNLIA